MHGMIRSPAFLISHSATLMIASQGTGGSVSCCSRSKGWPYTNHQADVVPLLMRPPRPLPPSLHFILKVFKYLNN